MIRYFRHALLSLALLNLLLIQTVLGQSPPDAPSQVPEPNKPVRVLTYNVRYASDQQPNRWADRRVVAKAMLDELQADVIGMQEALPQQVKDFESDLPGYQWIGVGRDGEGQGEHMAVFYRTSRLDPISHGHYWLSDTPEKVASSSWGNECKRMVTWVRFRDQLTKHEFYLINTHLDHQSQLSRDKSAQLIGKRAKELGDQLPVVLIGDFNSSDTSSSVYKEFMSAGFADTWVTAEEAGAEKNTFHGYRDVPSGSHTRIDWILSRGGELSKVVSKRSRIVEFEQGGQFPSDHFPVVADLIIQ